MYRHGYNDMCDRFWRQKINLRMYLTKMSMLLTDSSSLSIKKFSPMLGFCHQRQCCIIDEL